MKKLSVILSLFILSSSGLFASQNENPLHICGEVRVSGNHEWKTEKEFSFRSEAHFHMQYHQENCSVNSRIIFDTENNYFNNELPNIKIDQALIEYIAYQGKNWGIKVAVGRDKLKKLFSSPLQFNSHFNGLHIEAGNVNSFCNLTAKGALNMTTQSSNNLSFLGEISAENIKNLPLSLVYNFTFWNELQKDYISQVTLSSSLPDTLFSWCEVKPYLGVVMNHGDSLSHGALIGFTLGKAEKALEKEFDIKYQYLQTNCVPYFDRQHASNGVHLKGALCLTDHLKLQAKACLGDINSLEMNAIYKW